MCYGAISTSVDNQDGKRQLKLVVTLEIFSIECIVFERWISTVRVNTSRYLFSGYFMNLYSLLDCLPFLLHPSFQFISKSGL